MEYSRLPLHFDIACVENMDLCVSIPAAAPQTVIKVHVLRWKMTFAGGCFLDDNMNLL